MINIGIIEDNYFQLNNYREFLEDFQECKVIFACKSMEEFRELSFKEADVNVILLDISLPGESGIQGMHELRRIYPDAKIIVLSGHDGKHYVIESIRKGANGYIIKTSRLMEIYHSILDAISEGSTLSPKAAHMLINHINKDPLEDIRHKLTKREYELLALLKEGYSYKEMADKLFVTVFTVNQHLKKVYQKLNVATKSELISKIWSKSLCIAFLFKCFAGFCSNQFFA
ncbi:response regulator transcription factor [Chitinophaga sancti]|uniref:response regulator transcription factor n=1 Tax=Chitinophaga sancti TaxID=1004 RepID=UPI002A7534D0|nr:response regulator transcription factor [Chitinophaga sancti]WPQ65717.1 response regulator transcription factor [Chitinophaga sancti]